MKNSDADDGPQTSNRSDDGSHLSRDQSNDAINDNSDEDSLQIVENDDDLHSGTSNGKGLDQSVGGDTGSNRRIRTMISPDQNQLLYNEYKLVSIFQMFFLYFFYVTLLFICPRGLVLAN